MDTLNLAYPEKSDVKYKVIHYSDSHQHVIITGEVGDELLIKTRLSSMNDVFKLLQTTEQVYKRNRRCAITLIISYLLCGRYDRPMHAGDSFDLRIITELLQARSYQKILVYTPHSDITNALLESEAIYPLDAVLSRWLADYLDPDTLAYKGVCLVAADIGGVKRIHAFMRYLGHPIPLVVADKTRDLATGEVKGVTILNPDKLEDVMLIYDDLCDGGRTFTELSKKLIAENFGGKVILAVTQGVFGKGLDPIFEGGSISHVITTNSYSDHAELKDLGNYEDKLTVKEVI